MPNGSLPLEKSTSKIHGIYAREWRCSGLMISVLNPRSSSLVLPLYPYLTVCQRRDLYMCLYLIDSH